ncbi:MAG TPA: serine/threonine-protein kinase [Streptosporangiaceae bacterium]
MNDHLLGGRYRLSGRIAVGGMGEVWRGTDELLDRPVAVKLLSAAHASDDSFRARFRAEARYAASLSHPNIAQVFDYGEMSEDEEVPPDIPAGGAYLVMELVKGEPLSALIAREERLSAADSLRIVSQAADALSAAHEAGIVHRDIKPGNLLLSDEGVTKITDFGIARAMWAAQASHLTQTGMVMGTASYVSPEQATGGTITSASDIYSLGVVAYECLTGAPPFTAETPVAIAVAHMHRPVPPLPDDVPAPVADLILNMLAKPPEERPQSARWVADRARQLRSALPSSTGPGALLDPELNEAVLAETALDGGGPVLPSAEAVTDPRLGASLTRADLGLPAESTPTPPGLPAELGTGLSETRRRRRRSALLAALVSVAVAAIGGTVAAVMLSGKPMSTTGDVSPASSSVAAPSTGSRTTPAGSASAQSQVPGGFVNVTPTLRGNGGSGVATNPVAKPTARKTTTPVTKPTTVAPTTTGPTQGPTTSSPPPPPPTTPGPGGSPGPAS